MPPVPIDNIQISRNETLHAEFKALKKGEHKKLDYLDKEVTVTVKKVEASSLFWENGEYHVVIKLIDPSMYALDIVKENLLKNKNVLKDQFTSKRKGKVYTFTSKKMTLAHLTVVVEFLGFMSNLPVKKVTELKREIEEAHSADEVKNYHKKLRKMSRMAFKTALLTTVGVLGNNLMSKSARIRASRYRLLKDNAPFRTALTTADERTGWAVPENRQQLLAESGHPIEFDGRSSS